MCYLDFGRSLTPESMAETFCGSPLYMAPEIIRNQKYDAKVKRLPQFKKRFLTLFFELLIIFLLMDVSG